MRKHDRTRKEGETMNVKELGKELGISRATIYRRAQNAGITIERDENGELTANTIAQLGSLFDALGRTAPDAAQQPDTQTATDTNTNQQSESLWTLPEPEAAQRIHELEILCERLTAERDAARREAEIWQQQAQQWQEQANKTDARFDRLLQAAPTTTNTISLLERIRRVFKPEKQ